MFQSRIGTEVPLTTVRVAGGTSTVSGADEVTLDVEEVVGAAPGLDRAYVYVAPTNGSIAQVVNAIVAGQATTHVHVISDSWGLCEAAMSPAGVEANAHALQLAAVAGISVFAASGDDGSYDCFGFPMLSVDDPASEPWATGVGGTALNKNPLQRAAARGHLERGIECRWRRCLAVLGGALVAERPRSPQLLFQRRAVPGVARHLP